MSTKRYLKIVTIPSLWSLSYVITALGWLCISLGGISGCEDASSPDGDDEMVVRVASPCDLITCSGHGICVMIGDTPTCACDEGYRADPVNGLGCLEVFTEIIETTGGMTTGEVRQDGG